MSQPRVEHTATRLGNGKILVTGGYVGSSYSAGAEIYDETSNTWSATGSMSTPRGQHSATLLANGNVLVAGGGNGAGFVAGADLQRVDRRVDGRGDAAHGAPRPHRDAADERQGPRDERQHSSGATASVELYSPSGNGWSAGTSVSAGRSSATATRLANGNVLVSGSGFAGAALTASAEVYNPASGGWTATATTASTFHLSTATALANGSVLVVGGNGSSGPRAELYGPDAPTCNGLAATIVGGNGADNLAARRRRTSSSASTATTRSRARVATTRSAAASATTR